MAAVPIKPEYGPTLGRLLSRRWRAATSLMRVAVIVSGVVLSALILAAALTLVDARFSQGGRVPFSFSYRSLYRVAHDPGGYVKVQRRRANGRLEDSFAVEPLRLPSYSGGLSRELPLYATGYIRGLSRRYAHFVLRGEGEVRGWGTTKVNTLPVYDVFYRAAVEGRTMYGRDVLLLPERPGAREGVDIVMLTSPTANFHVTSPLEVASAGVLAKPLKTFSFG
jgi:hypothetical protein